MFPEIGLVNMEMVNEVNETHRECRDGYGSVHGPTLTDTWCRCEISTRIGCPATLIGSTTGDPLTVGTVELDHEHWELSGMLQMTRCVRWYRKYLLNNP